jgi:hypothetical protein
VQYGVSRPQLDDTIRVLFVSRRPYSSTANHKFIGRQIDNEEELLGIIPQTLIIPFHLLIVTLMQSIMIGVLRKMNKVEVTVVDFAKKSLADQIATVAAHDIVIAMHGAGMAHILWLPEYGGMYLTLS